MTLRILFAALALACLGTAASAQQEPKMTVTGGGYRLEGNKLVQMSKEETVCALMRQRNIEQTSACDERFARQSGLSIPECTALSKASTEACDAYAQTLLQEPLSVDQCMKATDRHHKCTLAITVGCEYTQALADKLESIRGIRDVDAISNAIKSECPRPDKRAMVSKAQSGTLRVPATPEAK